MSIAQLASIQSKLHEGLNGKTWTKIAPVEAFYTGDLEKCDVCL